MLESKYPGIEEALANYDAWAAKFVGMEDRIKDYVDTSFDEAETEIKDIIDNARIKCYKNYGNKEQEKDLEMMFDDIIETLG